MRNTTIRILTALLLCFALCLPLAVVSQANEELSAEAADESAGGKEDNSFFGKVNFWDTEVWEFIVAMSTLLAAIMLANILRTKVPFVRRLLIPSSVLGGLILLAIAGIWRIFSDEPLFDRVLMEELTYHGLGLGFAAMTLKNTEKKRYSNGLTDSLNSGLTVVGTYLIQSIIGLFITLTLSYVLFSENVKTYALGILTSLGYGQGPGQAYNWGNNYEVTYGFTHGSSFGLTLAALGFISASIGGIIYLNILRRKGRLKGVAEERSAEPKLEDFTGKNEVPHSESLDKMTIQVALVFIAYFIAYAFMSAINAIIDAGWLGNFGYNTLRPLLWGFNFLFAMLAAMLVKAALRFLRRKNIMKREYTNDFLQNRLSGFFFDIMVVASIAAIDLSAFAYPEFVIPLALCAAAALVITFIYDNIICRKLFPDYRDEAFLSLFGMLTGTASTGIILLREKDPNFETPASDNLVTLQPFAIAFGFPMLLLLPYAAQSKTAAWIIDLILVALFVVINIILFRKFIFKKKKKDKTK